MKTTQVVFFELVRILFVMQMLSPLSFSYACDFAYAETFKLRKQLPKCGLGNSCRNLSLGFAECNRKL